MSHAWWAKSTRGVAVRHDVSRTSLYVLLLLLSFSYSLPVLQLNSSLYCVIDSDYLHVCAAFGVDIDLFICIHPPIWSTSIHSDPHNRHTGSLSLQYLIAFTPPSTPTSTSFSSTLLLLNFLSLPSSPFFYFPLHPLLFFTTTLFYFTFLNSPYEIYDGHQS